MFKSQFSGKVFGPKVSPVKVVVATRPRQYQNWINKELIESEGWEIVKEISVAPDEVEQVKTKFQVNNT